MQLLHIFSLMRARLEAGAASRLGCRATAQDVMQETWIRLSNVPNEASIANPNGFITTVVNNAILGHLRKEKRRSDIDRDVNDILWESGEDRSPERVVMARDMLRALEEALGEMPERSRRIFLLNRIEGLSHRQIAAEYGISEEAVYYHVRRVLDRLVVVRDTRQN